MCVCGIVSNSSSSSDEKRDNVMKVHDDDGSVGDEFDLRENYQQAVECLVQCEYVMKSLQVQVANKDDQITGLEERVVQMSLELASAKAREDERSQELNRLKRSVHWRASGQVKSGLSRSWSVANSRQEGAYPQEQTEVMPWPTAGTQEDEDDDNDLEKITKTLGMTKSDAGLGLRRSMSSHLSATNGREEPQELQRQIEVMPWPNLARTQEDLTRMTEMNADLSSSFAPASKICPTAKYVYQQQHHEHQSEVMPWPHEKHQEEDAMMNSEVTRAHPEPSRREAFQFSRLAKRMSWGVNNKDGNSEDTLGTSSLNSLFLQDTSQKSQRGSQNDSNSSAKDSLRSMLSNTNINFSNRSNNSTSLDDSSSSRGRRSNLGQFFADLIVPNNNSNSICNNVAITNGKQGQFAKANIDFDRRQQERRSSTESSRSFLEGVVFPVSTSDCLVGLEKKKDDNAPNTAKTFLSKSYNGGIGFHGLACGNKRRCSDVIEGLQSASELNNAEWPEF